VWEVSNDTFQVLDQIEGFPNFYDRSIVSTTIGDAWMYHITEINQFRADELTPTLRGVLTWIK